MLALIPPSPPDLDQLLSAARAEYEAAREEFPEDLNTTMIVNGILEIVEETGVKAVPLVTQPWSPESYGDHVYSVFRLSVTASGAFTDLSGFIARLESGEPRTLVIKSLVADRLLEAPGEFEAKMEIAVYARPLSLFEE